MRSIKVAPRSISERIVYKISTMNKKPDDIHHNPYHELEAAYVAQICITWEALNWNYKNFQSKRASRRDVDVDVGCPATIAQQFQQFQVLLQRYVENEPYEHGRRPEIYARMRHLAPKLLLVPEYRGTYIYFHMHQFRKMDYYPKLIKKINSKNGFPLAFFILFLFQKIKSTQIIHV